MERSRSELDSGLDDLATVRNWIADQQIHPDVLDWEIIQGTEGPREIRGSVECHKCTREVVNDLLKALTAFEMYPKNTKTGFREYTYWGGDKARGVSRFFDTVRSTGTSTGELEFERPTTIRIHLINFATIVRKEKENSK